jgi:endoglucanase
MQCLPPLAKIMLLLCLLPAFSVCASQSPAASGGQALQQNHGFTAAQTSVKEWWNIPYPQSFDAAKLPRKQELIKIRGDGFITSSGQPFIFRGVNIADPGKLVAQQHWQKSLFEEIHRWGANTIRIPIHPLSWRQQGSEWFFSRIDEAVLWANALDMYLIIDWHSIGNLESEMYQHVMYETTQKETADFWRRIALRYKNVPTVAVYEIFNEPTHDYIGTGPQSLGRASWETWRELLEQYVDLIMVYNKNAIPLVAGHNWAYDLTPIAKSPLRRTGVAYAVHPYPQKAKPQNPTKENFFALWEKSWGYVADRYPVIATELGWVKEGGYGAHVPVINNDGTYGPNIVEYMEKKGVSYTVWIFDADWAPVMIKDWNYTPSEQGEFFRQEMLKAKAREKK